MLLSTSLAGALRAQARDLGADHVGIAPAALPSPEAGGPSAFRDWVAKGMHGEMGYMSRDPESREDVRKWFPKARSVLICAFSYHDGSRAPEPDPAKGRVARYALPPDYHDELKTRMKKLLSWYCENSGPPAGNDGPRGKVFVDTSPVLERLYARFAGVGWVGKNTMILSRKIGSFFLLAGMALDLDLEGDTPVADLCGNCTRCLDACPTQAFPRPQVLDASRCIAYFTVEHRKDPIPAPFREGHQDWIFGCDACQDACPWNRFSVKSGIFKPQLKPALNLEELARLSPQDFNKRYKGTPLRRTGRAAVVRNALLAMGNSGDRRHRPLLKELTKDKNPLIADQAHWSFRKLNFIK